MKLPFSFSLKFVFRLLFPGFVVTLALFPALKTVNESIPMTIDLEFIVVISTVLVGWLFMVLDMHIYMAFEGRRYWPGLLRKMFLAGEEQRLSLLQENYESCKLINRVKAVELSVELRRFPLDSEGEPKAVFPTRLGNLITAYEEYPLRVYGMNSIFYWYRIWLAIDEDLREQVDSQQAVTDSSIYMAAALYVSGMIALFYAGLQLIVPGFINHLFAPAILLALGLGGLATGYLIYRASLYLHASFGNIYMSLFDMHRDKVSVDEIIDKIAGLTQDQGIKTGSTSEKYMIAWRYMHNYKIKTAHGTVSAAKFPDSHKG